VQQGIRHLPQGFPYRSGIRGGEVRGPISLALTTGVAGTTSVEAVEERTSRGVQKPPLRVGGKHFPDVFLSSPEVVEMEETLVDPQIKPAWERADRHGSGRLARPPHQHETVSRRGVGCPARPRRPVRAGVEKAGGDDLILVSDTDGEGARAAVKNHIGAIVGPMQGGGTTLPWRTQMRGHGGGLLTAPPAAGGLRCVC
jgi:hypothetical protein